jgi:hypothetical protein
MVRDVAELFRASPRHRSVDRTTSRDLREFRGRLAGGPFFSVLGWIGQTRHTGQMPTSSAKPKLVPCHFTFEDLQLIEWSCREKAQRARSDAKRESTPSSIETFTSTATKYEALASRIQRLKELAAR